MELWDLYDRDGKRTGETWERQWGNYKEIPEGRYHLVVDILVQHVDGTYLLTKRHESKDVYPGFWEASAGGSAVKGEEPLEAAKREMKEETGLESDDFKLVNVSFRDPSHSMFYSYIAVVDCDKTSVVLQEGETVEYKWVDKEGLLEYSKSPLSIATHNNRYRNVFASLRGELKLLLFDLDGTLLTTKKVISEKTLNAVLEAKEKGYLVGISTSRSDSNSMKFIDRVSPDVIISSGGAMVKANGCIVALEGFTGDETEAIIAKGREICGNDLNISVDAVGSNADFYTNFVPPDDDLSKSWGEIIDSDFIDFREPSLKICFEIADDNIAQKVREELTDCDFIHFTDGDWYKITKAGITKESAIKKLCDHLGITTADVTAFGDDLADIGMLKMCGIGVAMGNALDEVKAAADITIGSNDEDGIAIYLNEL